MPPISNLPVAGGGQALQFQRFAPEQLQALEQLRSMGLSGLQSLQGLSNFEPIEQRARTQFHQQTVPTIAERFTSLGSGSALSSPAFASQLGAAGADLESQLGALRSQYGLEQQRMQQQRALAQLGLALQPTFETLYSPPGPGFGASVAGPLAQGLGASLPGLLSGGLGGIGGGILALLRSLLGGR